MIKYRCKCGKSTIRVSKLCRKCEIEERNFKILRLSLIDNIQLTYIAQRFGITIQQVSNIVKNADLKKFYKTAEERELI